MFRMSTLIAGQFRTIASEQLTSNNARTRKAIAKVRELSTKGKLNTPGMVRNHAEAAEAMNAARRWAAIERRVNR